MNTLHTIKELPDANIGKEEIRKYFFSTERSWFISNYEHFGLDGNTEFYIHWVLKNLKTTKLSIIEDLFILASEIGFYSQEINALICNTLKSKHRYFVKLACLDYLFSVDGRMTEDNYITFNQIAVRHTKNELVKLQAYLNLLGRRYEMYSVKVEKILANSSYPTLFYRVLNQDWKLSKGNSDRFCLTLKATLHSNSFDDSVKNELEEKLNNRLIKGM